MTWLVHLNILPVITHDDDGVAGVELDVGQLCLLLLCHHLLAQGLVLVDVQVIHVHLAIGNVGESKIYILYIFMEKPVHA